MVARERGAGSSDKGRSKDGAKEAGKGSTVSAFGWGGGDGPLNQATAGLVRDMIMGVDNTGRWGSGGGAVGSSTHSLPTLLACTRLAHWG